MKKLLYMLTVISAMLTSTQAQAGWEYTTSKDAMTDNQTASASSAFADITIVVFSCNRVNLFSDSYLKNTEIMMRFDKTKAITILPMQPFVGDTNMLYEIPTPKMVRFGTAISQLIINKLQVHNNVTIRYNTIYGQQTQKISLNGSSKAIAPILTNCN